MMDNLPSIIEAETQRSRGDIKPINKPVKEIPLGAPQASSEGEEGVYLADADCYNGANREKFSWSQKINELDIIVKIPKDVKTAKSLKVSIEKTHINVSLVDKTTIIDEDLVWPIKHTDVTWSFDPEEHKLNISCDKAEERWWESLFTTEEKINTRKIDCSRPITDLSEEAQAKIAQMKFDQEQKQKGLPTSDQMKMHDILKENWNKEGSPFQGQAFDPSLINMSTNG
ncbi:NudC domain containing 3 [Cichlidogyrus casuarinus]|uniref:NudC domain containing 3 n=1 Tax=Cichlidogyrus casuarinus TaxID=1844966 RepID=A0ABD2QD55_9PLAT